MCHYVTGVADENKSDDGLMISPNPADSYTHIEYFCKEPGAAVIGIYTIDGLKIINKTVNTNAGNNHQYIDISQLGSGIYSCSIHIGGKSLNGRFVIWR